MTLPMAAEWTPSRSSAVTSADLGDETVVYDDRTRSVHVLNGPAAVVWDLLDGAATVTDLTDAIAEASGVGEDVVRPDVEQLLAELDRLGLLVGGAEDAPAWEALGPPVPARSRTAALLDRLDWAHTTGAFRALDFRFRVRVPDPDLGRHLERVLAPLRSDDEAEHTYSVVDRGGGRRRRFALYLDGERLVTTSPERAAAAMVPWHVNRMAVERSPRYVCVHAAAAERDGRTVVLAGPQNAGKSTLVTGLLRAGWRYLTDEAVAVDPDTLLVHPYPKALNIDPGAQPLFADLEPEVPPSARRYQPNQWAVDPSKVSAVAAPSPVDLVLFCRYDRRGETRLVDVRPGDALVELARRSFNVAERGRRGFEALLGVVAGARCYRLEVADLDAAVEIVASLSEGAAQ